MKMSKDTYITLKSHIQIFTQSTTWLLGTPKQVMWRVLHKISFDLISNDQHPFYKNSSRIIPHNPNDPTTLQNLYKSLQDKHIESALLKIAKELQLEIGTPNQLAA